MTKQLLSIAICLTLLVTLARSANAQTAGASYNPGSGEVIFTIGEDISVVGLASLTGSTFDISALPRIGATLDISPAQFKVWRILTQTDCQLVCTVKGMSCQLGLGLLTWVSSIRQSVCLQHRVPYLSFLNHRLSYYLAWLHWL